MNFCMVLPILFCHYCFATTASHFLSAPNVLAALCCQCCFATTVSPVLVPHPIIMQNIFLICQEKVRHFTNLQAQAFFSKTTINFDLFHFPLSRCSFFYWRVASKSRPHPS